jgi:3' terminal RNA ribose 2'-O-methyltransferase Hen1
VPVLDAEKHYYVGEDEVEKLLRHGRDAAQGAPGPGGGWLAAHPERDLIVRRYLKRRRDLVDAALARLSDDAPDPDAAGVARDDEEAAAERAVGLHEQRIGAVVAALRSVGARRVLDLGCGEGRLLAALLADRTFAEVVGLDVSHRALQIAAERLRLDRLPPARRERIKLLHGALTYRDRRLAGYDAAAVVEVVEHLDPSRLAAFERALFEHARPGAVVLTTPNREYNARFPSLPAGQMRHRDHRFEWTRAELAAWAVGVADRHGYAVRFQPIGPEDPELGAPSQMAVFSRG